MMDAYHPARGMMKRGVHVLGILALLATASCDDDTGTLAQRVPQDAAGQDATLDAGVESGAGGSSGDAAVDSSVDGGAGADAATAWQYDLDGDGNLDTNLSVATCAAGTCLDVASSLVPTREITIAPTQDKCIGSLAGDRLQLIGSHAGDAMHEVSVLYCRNDGTNAPPALAIVDVSAGSVVAETIAPLAQTNAYADAPAAPDGKRHPFLAPSYGDGENAAGNWGALCVYRPDLAGGGACGAHFSSIAAAPNGGSYFREVGGTLQDLDGDGWQDITLIHHQRVQTLSPAKLTEISSVEYDVAAISEPGSPKWFHSGRNYGTHSAVVGKDGALRTVEVGGAPIGTFSDTNCNVSRFVAVLSSSAGAPQSRTLAWSKYFGFASTIFGTIDPAYASNPGAVVSRAADIMDGCVHRFSDSRTVMDGQEAVLVNYFAQSAPVDSCLVEQYALYLPPTWTDAKSTAWYSCFAKNAKASGVWGMQVLRESDGSGLTGGQHVYVWGWSSALLPGGEVVYLVENLPGAGAFDLSDRAPSQLSVLALVGGLFTARGTLPVAGRPVLRTVAPSGARGAGSYTYFAELELADRDGDGLADVHLESGDWVGYSTAKSAFVTK
ncbi:MAG: hypothetical protein R3B13_12645 [Polyangiaceae bacterium]